jgi:anti-sigma B factor antagonist
VDRKQESGGVNILRFEGSFDAANLEKVSEGIDALIAAGHSRFVFNLKGLGFINSSALGYIIKTKNGLEDEGGALVISEPSAQFETVITELGIDQMFDLCTSDDEALKLAGG